VGSNPAGRASFKKRHLRVAFFIFGARASQLLGSRADSKGNGVLGAKRGAAAPGSRDVTESCRARQFQTKRHLRVAFPLARSWHLSMDFPLFVRR